MLAFFIIIIYENRYLDKFIGQAGHAAAQQHTSIGRDYVRMYMCVPQTHRVTAHYMFAVKLYAIV